MTLYNPTLIVKRLKVFKGRESVYDEIFHEGINVIAGRNGGGKTSVIQLLVFGLGYEVNNWKNEAGQCDRVYVEVKANGCVLTLKRDNVGGSKQGLDLCYESLDVAIKSPPDYWYRFPYAIGAKESFSQKLFSVLGLPEARIDASGNNITMHQVLRLIYSDQSNIARCLFNVESFDSAFKRESVGNYLLGIYDNELYDAKIDLAAAEKDLDSAVSKLKAIHSVLGKTSFSKGIPDIDEAKEFLLGEIQRIQAALQTAKDESYLSYKDERKYTESSAVENVKIKTDLLECESGIRELQYEIEDSEFFIKELEDKLCSVDDSLKVGEVLPELVFRFCPACYSELKEVDQSRCQLCGVEKAAASSGGNVNLLRMKNEISVQLRESQKIIARKKVKLSNLEKLKKELRASLRKNINKIASVVVSTNSALEGRLYSYYKEMGEVEEKMATLDKVRELYSSINEVTVERDKLQRKVNDLKGVIELKNNQFFQREPEVRSTISKHLVNILREDVGTEKEFKAAESVEFDFSANFVAVNGKSSFSESGEVYLNNAFHLALLLTSLEKEYVRIPRLMILDGIENGGMEDVRSRNFQRVAKTLLEKYDVYFQFIFTTKSVFSDLDKEEYLVGGKYGEGNKSLGFV
jgi:hypothetical protein